MIDRGIVCDLEDPAGEFVLRPVRSDRVEGFDEGFLRKVFRELPITHHPEDQREHRALVPADQLAVRGLTAVPGEDNDFLIGESGEFPRLSHGPAVGLRSRFAGDYIARLC